MCVLVFVPFVLLVAFSIILFVRSIIIALHLAKNMLLSANSLSNANQHHVLQEP